MNPVALPPPQTIDEAGADCPVIASYLKIKPNRKCT